MGFNSGFKGLNALNWCSVEQHNYNCIQQFERLWKEIIKLKFNLFEKAGKEPRQKHNKETNSLEKEQKEHLTELNFT